MSRGVLAFSAVRTEGGLLPGDILQRIALEDRSLAGLTPEAYHLDGVRLRDAVNQAWTRLTVAWRSFQTALAKLPEADPATVVTRDKWILPLFSALGYGHLPKHAPFEALGKSYPISHAWHASPIHLVGCRVDIDARDKKLGSSPHGLVQDFLNRSEPHLWGFVCNGHTLRVLRDHHSLTQQAYVEFDLEAIFEGEAFSEFLLLWLTCHQSRVEAEKPEECWLEKWFNTARDEGVRALDQLRAGVEQAIAAFGTGFLRHKANRALHQALESGDLDKQDYYRQLLRLAYRLIFLFVAEDRGALLDPKAPLATRARYERWYATRRLRELAGKRRGGPHGDLWRELRLVMGKLWDGSPELGLPALGSFLWRPSSTGDLNDLELANEDLLTALRALSYVEQGKVRHAVSFRNVGAEELGSVYESLLELHPEIHKEAARFELSTAAGHERKTTGSYYTPTALVDCLLDSALEPVLDEAGKAADPEKAILDLKVCDPACGSGHFLVAAARRMALRLATVRSSGEEPSPRVVERALRDVVGKCIFGVDLNPMAVELCKVSLWMEAIEPGRPLSFLDGHIQQGNALLGATPALMEKGIPDEAFEPIEGDDRKVASALKKQNKKERGGQTSLFADFARAPESTYVRLTSAAAHVEADKDDDIAAVRKKEQDWELLTGSADYTRETFLADAWCAAFVWPKQAGAMQAAAITQDLWERMRKDAGAAPAATRKQVRELAREYAFFHWHLAFPQVFLGGGEADKQTGWRGGFDVVLGNPPWDELTPAAKEFFATYDPHVRSQDKAGEQRITSQLLKDPAIERAWKENCRFLYAQIHYIKQSGRYRLFAPGNLGKGDFNVYRMFVETCMVIARRLGQIAQLVPEGLYSGANAMAIRRALFDHFDWRLLLGFENAQGTWFPSVHTAAKFCLYAAKKGNSTATIRAAFSVRSLAGLNAAMAGRTLQVPVPLVEKFSPDALAIMELSTQRDIDIATKMYSAWPTLGDLTAGPPYRQHMREVDMTVDRPRFCEDPAGLPVYEGRMIDNYDHRAKAYRSGRARTADWAELAFGDREKCIKPQWYVLKDSLPEKLENRTDFYRVGFCNITSPTNERTLIAALIPPNCVCGNTVPTISFEAVHEWSYMLWLGVANSFVMDFLARKKIGLHVTNTILDSLPFPRVPAEDERARHVVDLAARLTCTAPEMRAYWDMLGMNGWVPPTDLADPYPGIIEPVARLAAVADIEAIVAHDLYGLARDDLSYIMDTFPIVEKRDVKQYGSYRTKELVLAAYDRLAMAADPRVAYPATGSS